MNHQKHRNDTWKRRKKRVRKKVVGTPDRPRLTVFRSARNIYAQVIDDVNGFTLVAASTLSDKLDDQPYCGNITAAEKIGAAVARKALAVGIHQVCFDRNGYKYHGRVKALAQTARKAGLVF